MELFVIIMKKHQKEISIKIIVIIHISRKKNYMR